MSAHKSAASQVGKVIAHAVLAILVSTGVPLRLAAQENASLWGSVKDPCGAGIAGATVRIRNLDTGAERDLLTAEDGRVSAPSLFVGRYEVAALKAGFRGAGKTA